MAGSGLAGGAIASGWLDWQAARLRLRITSVVKRCSILNSFWGRFSPRIHAVWRLFLSKPALRVEMFALGIVQILVDDGEKLLGLEEAFTVFLIQIGEGGIGEDLL